MGSEMCIRDRIGTDPDDPRMEKGFRKVEPAEQGENVSSDAESAETTDAGDNAEMDADGVGGSQDESAAASVTSEEDIDEAVEEFDLSRRHVLTPLGRSQIAKRWYEGPRGPKSLSTKTSDGNPCSTCGFFIPLKGELNLLFGVCANKWSPDDGRVVSIDHGCGEHSEIEPPEPSHLWVQSKPAFDDLHIDIIAQAPRDERSSVELIEQLSVDEDGNPNDEEEASEADIEANTVDDGANQEEVLEHTAPQDEPEVEATVKLGDDEDSEVEEVSENDTKAE